ncbi:MAG: hypothetical protein IT521_00810 [Burkholderiales bacterium]|nr:hypothetical protein [Burkholderiales bacterium]
MSRFLCIAPPYAGHVFPLASIGSELAQRGHAVAWLSYAAARAYLPPDVPFFEVPHDDVMQRSDDAARSPRPRFLASEFAYFYGELVVPMAAAMLPHVEQAVAQWRPDVVLADQHALAGAIVARTRGLRWATSAATSLLHAQSIDRHASARRWLRDLLAHTQRELGVPVVDEPDVSPELVLLYVSRELAGPGKRFPEHYRFVGPVLEHRHESTSFPWHRLLRRPRVAVSLGSVVSAHGGRFLETAVAALRDEPVEVVIGAPDGALAEVPANFVAWPWLPNLALLPKVDAAVSHGGSFAFEALASGVPLVVAPFWTDQFATAGEIVAAGAGIRVRYGRVGAKELREAVSRVVHDPSYRRSAIRVQAGLRAAGGTRTAADFCAGLAAGTSSAQTEA